MSRVLLLAHTPEPERTVASAAKLCYSPSSIETVREGLTPEKTASFVEMLAQIGHESPIEHAVFTFGIEGVSRSLLAQITRHRIASFSVQSQRYVREKAFEFVVPPAIRAIPEAADEFLQAMEEGGLIRRVPVGYDARLKKIELTDYAGEIRKQLEEQIRRTERQLTEGFSEEELDAFFSYVRRFN